MKQWPLFKKTEIEAVTKVLRSGKVNYWTGKEGRQFEEEYAKYVGVKHAIAVSNGSVALELALIALGIGPGDEVVVTSAKFHRICVVCSFGRCKACFCRCGSSFGKFISRIHRKSGDKKDKSSRACSSRWMAMRNEGNHEFV